MIEDAAEKGELTPLVLLVIRNRLELARHDVLSPPPRFHTVSHIFKKKITYKNTEKISWI